MGSLYLNRLSPNSRCNLEKCLFESQRGKCFICEESISLDVHAGAIDIDHIVPTKVGGKDDPINFALTHSSCNRSKQDTNLKLARILHQFAKLTENLSGENRGPNLSDILKQAQGSKYEINFQIKNGQLRFSLPEIGDSKIIETPIYLDDLSGFSYSFLKLPIEYVFHDDKINPRSIGRNISKLLREFYMKRPQLHISLGWIDIKKNQRRKVRIFDGQHKATAQVLLGIRNIPLRLFINPNVDILLTTNTNAGTTLRQIAFDKSVQRHLGSSLYVDRVDRYKKDLELPDDDYNFSEKALVQYFKGESREMKRYILDSVRDSITHSSENKLREYIDFAGKGKERPLSYSSIEKTFYSFFICQEVLETPLSYKLEEGTNPRELEKEQIVELMNLITEEFLINKFDTDIGTYRIENRIQKGEHIPLEHVKAQRVTREEVMYNWLRYLEQIIKNFFIMQGRPIKEKKLFQYKFPNALWEKIRIFLQNFWNLPVWSNNELSATVFGGKQNNDFWQIVFESGKSPQGVAVLSEPLDLMKMIQR